MSHSGCIRCVGLERPKIFGHRRGANFAVLTEEGCVVSWGTNDAGMWKGTMASDVQHILCTQFLFIDIKTDSSVVIWGDATRLAAFNLGKAHISDSVKQVVDNYAGAFAAVKHDGSVACWGDRHSGGDCSWVRDELASDVRRVVSSSHAFAALKGNGSVVTWGHAEYGGDSARVKD